MRQYIVLMPVTGYLEIPVEAESEDEAIEAAWEKYNTDGSDAGELTWETTDVVANGNVCNAMQNSIEAVEVSRDEEDEEDVDLGPLM